MDGVSKGYFQLGKICIREIAIHIDHHACCKASRRRCGDSSIVSKMTVTLVLGIVEFYDCCHGIQADGAAEIGIQ